MLYSLAIRVSNGSPLDDIWRKEMNEKHKFSYIENKSLRQRIRLGKGIRGISSPDSQTTQKPNEGAVYAFTQYRNEEVVCFSNSHTNMALSAVTRNPEDAARSKEFTDVAYITLENINSRLMRYTLVDRDHTDIIQTFRKKNGYQGCAVGFNKDTFKGNVLMSLDVEDIDTKRYTKYDIILDRADGGGFSSIHYEIVPLQSKDIAGLKKIEERYKNRFLSFKMTLHANPYPTSTYIATEDNYDKAVEVLRKNAPKDYRIILLPNGDALNYLETVDMEHQFLEPADQRVHDMLIQHLVNERTRAVTLLDIDVPYQFCKQYNILYLFKNTSEKGYTFCLRSN